MSQVNIDPGGAPVDNGGGSGAVAAVAIVVIVLLAILLLYFLFFRTTGGDGSLDVNVDVGTPTALVRSLIG
jgi:hypothetical protein